MKRRLALLAAITLAACADQTTAPTASAPEAPRPDTRRSRASVIEWESMALADGGDWTRAIQTAVRSAQTVFFPGGRTYTIRRADIVVNLACAGGECSGSTAGSIYLPSGTRVVGAGATSLIKQEVPDAGVFLAFDSAGGFVSGITVDSLAFTAPPPPPAGEVYKDRRDYALWTRRANHVKVRWNKVDRLGVYANDHYLEVPDPYEGVTTLSFNILVQENTAVGRDSGFTISNGASFGYADSVVVVGNKLSHYDSGIMWHGGDALINGAPGNTRKVRRVHVRDNRVRYTFTGIWGGMGENISVKGNHSSFCYDLCLDSEGDINATFENNTAKNARNSVLGVYRHGRNIVFRRNQVSMDDSTIVKSDGTAAPDIQNQLFSTSTWYDSSRVYVLGNRFRYLKTSGIGRISKSATREFYFVGDTVENALLDFPENHNGALDIRNNRITLTRAVSWNSTDRRAAIRVDKVYGPNSLPAPNIYETWELVVSGNVVLSTVAQGSLGTGIRVEESNPYQPWLISHLISFNHIDGFVTAIFTSGTRGKDDYFKIDQNTFTGVLSYNPDNWNEGSDVEGCVPTPPSLECP